MNFDQLGLSAELLRAIDEQGYTTATPVQQQTIPLILEGQDVLAGAQTGTGKTAGFALPILMHLQKAPPPSGKRPVRVLVLAPTRELAAQVCDSFNDYGRHLSFRAMTIFGGVSIRPQISTLRKGVDIMETQEWFGAGGKSAYKEVFISSRLARLILDQGWKGVMMKVVELMN